MKQKAPQGITTQRRRKIVGKPGGPKAGDKRKNEEPHEPIPKVWKTYRVTAVLPAVDDKSERVQLYVKFDEDALEDFSTFVEIDWKCTPIRASFMDEKVFIEAVKHITGKDKVEHFLIDTEHAYTNASNVCAHIICDYDGFELNKSAFPREKEC